MFVPTQVFVMFEQIGAFCRLLTNTPWLSISLKTCHSWRWNIDVTSFLPFFVLFVLQTDWLSDESKLCYQVFTTGTVEAVILELRFGQERNLCF